ncbi:hypothetical protein A4A49_55077 [Nicotiana attenuata]|uniref:Uncharacterized protein n=1 Tax=Nicotiana attenuata TaxID=49451 RepID=A0A1J6JQ71_NICAT|nr:hypothetical protein A4A49_55077 [Nicotiana attenuata]
MMDINEALALKRWWRFRTCESLWSTFLKYKYCTIDHPVKKKWRTGQSHGWKKLMQVKDKVEDNMLWKINSSNSSLWWDNWTGFGDIAQVIYYDYSLANQTVNDIIVDGRWSIDHLQLPEYMTEQILSITIGDTRSMMLIFGCQLILANLLQHWVGG